MKNLMILSLLCLSVHAEDECLNLQSSPEVSLTLRRLVEKIEPFELEDMVMRKVREFEPEFTFETTVQIAEGRAPLFVAIGECTYQDAAGNWQRVERPIPKNSPIPSDAKPLSLFSGTHVNKEAATLAALKDCYDEMNKLHYVKSVRFSSLDVSPVNDDELKSIQNLLKENLNAIGFKSCFEQKEKGILQTVPESCSLERSKISKKTSTILKYALYSALGGFVYRVRGGMWNLPVSKTLWLLTATGIGYYEGGKDGAIAGGLMYVATQWREWGSCFDYGHSNGTKYDDAVKCAERMGEVSYFPGAYLAKKGYDTTPLKLSAVANGEIYRNLWNLYDFTDTKSAKIIGFPTDDAEFLVGASAIPALVASLRSKENQSDESPVKTRYVSGFQQPIIQATKVSADSINEKEDRILRAYLAP